MTRNKFLPFSPPLIGEEEIAEVVDSLRSGWITTGPKVKAFERAFADYVGAPAALAVSSATDAMLIGLAALGVGAGDEVITTPMTFCSTLHVIEHLGARPVLADVEPDTLNINPRLIEKVITPKTKGMIPVHLYGHPCEMDELCAIADRRGLFILEDAAHAFPASYKGRSIGTIGTLTSFSFYATKNVTTAEGGMLVGAPDLIDSARVWGLHGMSRDAFNRYTAEGSWYYEVVLPGYKCNMTDMQAALGLWQLKKLRGAQERRSMIAKAYTVAFSKCQAIEIPITRVGISTSHHIYPIRLISGALSIDRSAFIQEMKKRNIGTSVHFIPNHIQPYYREKYGYQPDDFPVAHREYQRLVSLPINLVMTDADVTDVIEAVFDVVSTFGR